MGTISLTDAVAGTTANASLINNNNTTLEGTINGGIDDANLEASQIVTGSTHFKVDGATAGQVYAMNAGATAWAPTSIGMFLGIVSYNPTTATSTSTTSTTLADIDATNLVLTVTVKHTGKLVFILNAVSAASNIGNQFWGIRESTTDIVEKKITGSGVTSTGVRTTHFLYVTGISLGSHTYKWAQRTTSGAAGVATHYGTQASPATTDFGPATMMIVEVP